MFFTVNLGKLLVKPRLKLKYLLVIFNEVEAIWASFEFVDLWTLVMFSPTSCFLFGGPLSERVYGLPKPF